MRRYVLFAVLTISAAAIAASPAYAQSSAGQITVLYDAFGKTSTLKKDWGFSALVEYGGKRRQASCTSAAVNFVAITK